MPELVQRITAGSGIVHDAIYFFAERIDGIHRISASSREEEKRIVEVASTSSGHGPAVRLSFGEGHNTHAARISSRLRRRERSLNLVILRLRLNPYLSRAGGRRLTKDRW